ncbi:MAG: metallophosphoesterase [Bacillota bacterium]
MSKFSFYHLTDLHYFSKRHFSGDVWATPLPCEQIPCRMTEEAIKKVVSDIIADINCDTVIVSGDITNNGEPESHEDMCEILRGLQAGGKKVYAFIASHDANDKHELKKMQEGFTLERCPYAVAHDYYKEFGVSTAIAVYEPNMSYVAQLAEGVRLLAILPDTIDKHFSSEYKLWLQSVADDAKKSGNKLFAAVHYPMLTPSPLYRLIGGDSSFIKNPDQEVDFLSSLGIELLLSGHTHIHNVAVKKVNDEQNFYQITTAALTGYPCLYRKIEWDLDSNSVDIQSLEVGEVVTPVGVKDMAETSFNGFIGYIGGIVADLPNDATALTRIGGGMEQKANTLNKFGFLIRGAGKFINNLTFGKLARFVKKESGLQKEDYKDIADKKVMPFIMDLIASLYDGKPKCSEDSLEYRIIMGAVAVIDDIIAHLPIDIKKLTKSDSVYSLMAPLLCGSGFNNYNIHIDFKGEIKQSAPPKKLTSKKGAPIILGTIIAIILLIPIIVPCTLIIALIMLIQNLIK